MYNFQSRGFIWLLLCLLTAFTPSSYAAQQQPLVTSDAPKRIAIIGAGAGGSFAAYELRRLANEAGLPLNISIYERASYIGGRSTTVDAFDDPAYPIELGASIFVQVNQILVNASRDLGLGVRSADYARPREAAESIGIWDGTKFVFTLKNNYSWWNIGRLFWRYGFAPLHTQNLMKNIVGRFLRLYEKPIFPFQSLSEAAEAVDLLESTSETGSQFVDEKGIGLQFAREIIQASTRVNYGQNLDIIHGLESMVCMATDGAVSIEGGNWQIFDGAIKASQADVRLNTTVSAIKRSNDLTFKIASHRTGDLDSFQSSEEAEYDEIVLAGPLQYSGISISPPLDHIPDEIPYVKLHVTLLSTPHRISSAYFGLQRKDARAPETILTTQPEGQRSDNSSSGVGPAGFWSISTLRTITRKAVKNGEEYPEQHYVYKIFSPERPSAEFIANVFDIEYNDTSSASIPRNNTNIGDLPENEISWFHEKVWDPYPVLHPRVTFEETLLAPRVWYTSGIESFISTMETSALMGRNVAALILQSWQKQSEQDRENLMQSFSPKTEL